MTELRFVDTNILLYAHDRDAGSKHDRAKQLLIDLWNEGNGCLSSQVLQEFFVNVTKKIPQPLSTSIAREILRTYLPWVRVATDGEMAIRASEIADAWQTSFWDGMIIAAAERSGATELLSEDLQSGQRIAGIFITDPLTNFQAK
ncbi:MAG: PIN domain-containing protein [Hydrogenophilales bacterium]|nr:PIN domain-containing protein [Hydrogenophilales bacterium]